jgi:NADH-quinone oxidoreductase subunit C
MQDELKPAEQPALKKPVSARPANVMVTQPIVDDPLIGALQTRFGNAILRAETINSQQVVTVASGALLTVVTYLRQEATPLFNMLTDLTALHWPQRDPDYEIVYQLYALSAHRRLRIKAAVTLATPIDTVVALWSTANWLEREVYDLFGLQFAGHPDLRRLLLPSGWVGHPLRKDYPLEYQDNSWVENNLQIRELPMTGDFTGKFE